MRARIAERSELHASERPAPVAHALALVIGARVRTEWFETSRAESCVSLRCAIGSTLRIHRHEESGDTRLRLLNASITNRRGGRGFDEPRRRLLQQSNSGPSS